MIKTIKIDGRDVTFKSTGGTLLRYRNEFNSEMLADLMELENAKNDFSKFNTTVIAQMIWVAAKTADSTIPDMYNWFDSFDEFPMLDVFAQLKDLFAASMKIISKNG